MAKHIAVSVKSMDGLESEIDPRFGRANAFVIVEFETRNVVTQFFNNAVSVSHGAGTATSVAMQSNNVDSVISGRFGPKAYEALKALNIDMWIAPVGITAREAIDRLSSGTLKREEVKVY